MTNLYCKIDLTPAESGVFDQEVEISTDEDEE